MKENEDKPHHPNKVYLWYIDTLVRYYMRKIILNFEYCQWFDHQTEF